jgi:hypothetical protein
MAGIGEQRRNLVVIGLVLLLLLAMAAFAYRPSPILGVDGGSLARSIDFIGAFEDCVESESDWTCPVLDSQLSGEVPYRVTVDSWGCWSADRLRFLEHGSTPRHLDGCISLFHHFDP